MLKKPGKGYNHHQYRGGIDHGREKTDLYWLPHGMSASGHNKGWDSGKVTGNTCKRGADYGKKEVTDPTRIVTSTVRVQGGTLPVVSVKTRGDIPKSSVMDCVLAESYVK